MDALHWTTPALVVALALPGCVIVNDDSGGDGDESTGQADDGATDSMMDGMDTGADDGATGAETGVETGAETGVDETGVDETGTPPSDCLGTNEGTAGEGDACVANDDCESGVCTIYTDIPINADAVCGPVPANCGTRVTGTIFDFSTLMPVADAEVAIVAALQAATNPTRAMAIISATSDADGRIDGVSDEPINAALGIVALAERTGYYLTSSGVAAPADGLSGYDVANHVHDLWMVPAADLTAWSDELSNDVEIGARFLPLGDQGGVIGLVRDADGNPLAGAVVSSTSDPTQAVVRYLDTDGTFGDVETSATGIFVIVDPAIPEDFEVSVDGAVVGSGTAGSAAGVVFTLIVNVD